MLLIEVHFSTHVPYPYPSKVMISTYLTLNMVSLGLHRLNLCQNSFSHQIWLNSHTSSSDVYTSKHRSVPTGLLIPKGLNCLAYSIQSHPYFPFLCKRMLMISVLMTFVNIYYNSTKLCYAMFFISLFYKLMQSTILKMQENEQETYPYTAFL